MSWLDRLTAGFKKTADKVGENITGIVHSQALDTATLDDIEEAGCNVVFNAVDALPSGGTITLRTTQSVRGAVQIEIQDDGVGMDEATRQRCLEPFFTTKGERGT